MNQNNPKIKYFLYARKSTEAEDRQVASIEAQIKELKKIIERDKLIVVEILSESWSAKRPGRPIFNQMIERIHNGEAQGILCWKLNRLARNPIDGGTIMWMLQESIIQHIQTYGQSYYPTDNVLPISVEFGMANQFSRDLSVDTKRGLIAKAEKGWFPGVAPIGFLNNKFKEKGKKDILKDLERFKIVRKMWDTLLEKKLPIQKIHQLAINEWGLRFRSGRKLSRSQVYRIFTSPFYYGYFQYAGTLYKGNHDPMITEEEFYQAQIILGNKSRPRIRTHNFAFRSLIRCGECGAMITAEEKWKHQKNGNVHHYIYYRCTKRKNPNCAQKTIREDKLVEQIIETLGTVEIPSEFYELAIEVIRDRNKKESESRTAILNSQQKAYNACIDKIDALIDMRARGELTEEEFVRKKTGAMQEKAHFKELLKDTDNNIDDWVEYNGQAYLFAKKAKEKFETTDDVETKKQILGALGSNLFLKDRKLIITVEEPLVTIKEIADKATIEARRLEPLKIELNKKDFERAGAQNLIWGA